MDTAFAANDNDKELRSRVTSGLWAAVLLSGGAIVAISDPVNAGFFPQCPLYRFTGLACPGCGLTRGFHALFHGDVIGALDFNLLIPVWCVIFAFLVVYFLTIAFTGKRLRMWPTDQWFVWSFMSLMLVFGVLRNIPVWPFTILYP